MVEHGLAAVHGVDHQFDEFGVRRGEQLDVHSVAVHGNRAVNVDDAVDEQQDVVCRCRNSEIFAHEKDIVPLACSEHRLRGRLAVDGQRNLEVHRLRFFGFTKTTRQRRDEHQQHEEEGS